MNFEVKAKKVFPLSISLGSRYQIHTQHRDTEKQSITEKTKDDKLYLPTLLNDNYSLLILNYSLLF